MTAKLLPPNLPAVLTGMGAGNYPAGANIWSGQPTGVAPVSPYYTPAQPPPAEYAAFADGKNAATIQAFMDVACASYAANWPYFGVIEGTVPNANAILKLGAGVDASNSRVWYGIGGSIVQSGTSSAYVLRSDDGGVTLRDLNLPNYHSVQGGGSPIMCIAGDYQGGVLVVTGDFSTTPKHNLLAYYSGTWHQTLVARSGSATLASMYFDATNSKFVFAGDAFGLNTVPVNSTTLTFTTFASIPAGASSVQSALVAQKGDGSGVLVPATQTGTVWAHSVAFASPTATSVSYGTFTVTNTESVRAMDYGLVDGVYMCAVYTGAYTRFMSSPDGLVWTSLGGGGGPNGDCTGLACLGGRIWVCCMTDSTLFVSLDAGATWNPTGHKVASDIFSCNAFVPNVDHTQLMLGGLFSYKNLAYVTETRLTVAGWCLA